MNEPWISNTGWSVVYWVQCGVISIGLIGVIGGCTLQKDKSKRLRYGSGDYLQSVLPMPADSSPLPRDTKNPLKTNTSTEKPWD